ncbi:MAG: CehA/McbA family metallohydrolase [Armatimonadota bacterium]
MLQNPFSSPGNWYRANLHAHTTKSDGNLSPEQCVEFYHGAGYQVLAITDHSHVTTAEAPPGMLLLSGVEWGGGKSRQGTHYHVVGLNVKTRGKMSPPDGAGPQQLVDALRADGGETFIAHPYWSGLMAEDVASIKGCFAVEVYNTGCDLEIMRGFSQVHWDDLLTLGCEFGAVAVDDGHVHPRDHGLGWTMIRAEALTSEAIMSALTAGRYYSSIGPEILDIAVAGKKVKVRTSPVASIALVSSPEQGARCFAAPGKTITAAEFEAPQARYWRIEAWDSSGKVAWSNAFAAEEARSRTFGFAQVGRVE